jgi:hypothetical protein
VVDRGPEGINHCVEVRSLDTHMPGLGELTGKGVIGQ